MTRFIGLAWPEDDVISAVEATRLAQRAEPAWRSVVNSAGLIVLVPVEDQGRRCALELTNERGVVLGQLFYRGRSAPCDSGEIAQHSEVIVATSGRHLADHFWGSYVAFLRDPRRREVHVVRDCSGRVACYRARGQLGSVQVFFSNVGDALKVGIEPPSINWRYVSAFLFYDDLRIRESGLDQIDELLAGECCTISSRGISQFSVWNPVAVVENGAIRDYEEASHALHRSAHESIACWAGESRKILVSLSGGFDSAVVLGCLSKLHDRPAVVCLNKYEDAPGEDERFYAKAAARHCATELVEVAWRSCGTRIDESLFARPLQPKPSVLSLGVTETAFRDALARQLEADVVWTGNGGDQLFFQARTKLFAADYVHDLGIGLGLGRVIADAARFSDESIWEVTRSAIALGVSRKPWSPASPTDGQQPFVREALLDFDVISYIQHPWFVSMDGLPKGKQLQLRAIAELVNKPAGRPDPGAMPECHPLVSQPLIETCLRIPTYLLLQGGRNRALARRAFRQEVPSEIIERNTKGCTRTYTFGLIRDNMDFVRELLLDGALVKQQILERKSLEPYLMRGHPLRPSQLFPLLACVAAESWARSWSEQALRAAA